MALIELFQPWFEPFPYSLRLISLNNFLALLNLQHKLKSTVKNEVTMFQALQNGILVLELVQFLTEFQ